MKNILNIITHDARRLTSSVVAIITIMGLCIVPCLYAWFNIFSNWAPYESDATGRIRVAVASEDAGAEMLGLRINVGDKITDALKANNDIGWQFVDTKEEAIEGVYAGDYYAALIVPEDFSMDVMSFVSGSLENPKLIYYENEKKNAIAPKITGKAKTAVQEQVNATFIETLAKYVSDAASVVNASGYDPQKVFSDLGYKMDLLNERLEDCAIMLNAVQGLASSADNLMKVSDNLLGSAETVVDNQSAILDSAESTIPKTDAGAEKAVKAAVEKEKAQLDKDLSTINSQMTDAAKDVVSFNEYVDSLLPDHLVLLEDMRQSAERTEKYLNDLGYTGLAGQFRESKERIEALQKDFEAQKKAAEESWEEKRQEIDAVSGRIEETRKQIDAISTAEIKDLDTKLDTAVANARKSVDNVRSTLSGMSGDLSGLADILNGYNNSLGKLQASLVSTEASLGYMQNGVSALAEIFNRIAGNRSLKDVNDILANDETAVAEYLASPVKMKTEVIYPIETYGSAMAPFYTVLAQWVGALLTAVLIKTNVKKREGLENLRQGERFFGRYALYMFIGLAQALIVSLGDLLYVNIQCEHPVLFVLQACMNGIVFMMINYALVFALENIGLGAGVIILVLQVAGSGGTYPVEVLPRIFQILYPAMPFRYSMNAMRECIAGTYDHTYAKCMAALCLFFIGAVLFGLILHRPAKWINRRIAESKEKSEIML